MSKPPRLFYNESIIGASTFFSAEPHEMMELLMGAIHQTMTDVSTNMADAGFEPVGSPQLVIRFEATGKKEVKREHQDSEDSGDGGEGDGGGSVV